MVLEVETLNGGMKDFEVGAQLIIAEAAMSWLIDNHILIEEAKFAGTDARAYLVSSGQNHFAFNTSARLINDVGQVVDTFPALKGACLG